MDATTLKFYSDHATMLARTYAGASDGVEQFFREAFLDCRKVLDIGCGAGRDFLELMRAGHDAYAVDASEAMVSAARDACRRHDLDVQGRLFTETLPDLRAFADDEFDGVLCSAVLMHVPESQLFDAVYSLRRVLKPGGRLLVSVPSRNGDVDPESRRDADGRLFTDLPPEKLCLLLERVGFRLLWSKISADSLGRENRTWAVMLLAKSDDASTRPLDTVESVLNRDKKDATYKLALFRALAEIAQTNYNIARYKDGSKVHIPIEAIAEKWLRYYWPLLAHDTFIPQKNGESASCAKPVAFRQELDALIDRWRGQGGLSAFVAASRSGALPSDTKTLQGRLMSKLKQTIWNMPVRYAGGGKDFSIMQYDKATATVVLSADMWRELSLTGSWIQDATILRWAELTSRLSKGAIKTSTVVECLLSCVEPERDVAAVRNVYLGMSDKHCVWTDKPIRQDFDVDHVIPFALWKSNDLWNLLPVLPAVNNEKRDRLPTQQVLRASKDRILHCWGKVRSRHATRFDREAAALCGGWDPGNWESQLFGGLAEAVEITAVQRGVGRWQPEQMSVLVHLPERPAASPVRYPEARSSSAYVTDLKEEKYPAAPPVTAGRSTPEEPLFAYADIEAEAFQRYLPVVASLAAGEPFDGFEVGGLDWAPQCSWVEVPRRLAGKNRFVIRVAGDSMEPAMRVGDLVAFEYHRTPRKDNQIVIANLTAFGIDSSARTAGAVKRLTQDAQSWIFRSDNPAYEDIRVPKSECQYPILGIMVGMATGAR